MKAVGLLASFFLLGLLLECPHVLAARTEKMNQESCVRAGGDWHPAQSGRNRIEGCNLPTKDAGNFCDHSKQCESVCIAHGLSTLKRAGQCYDWTQYRGCRVLQKKNNGILNVCID